MARRREPEAINARVKESKRIGSTASPLGNDEPLHAALPVKPVGARSVPARQVSSQARTDRAHCTPAL